MERRPVDDDSAPDRSSQTPGLYGWVTDYAHTEPATLKGHESTLRKWLYRTAIGAAMVAVLAFVGVVALSTLRPDLGIGTGPRQADGLNVEPREPVTPVVPKPAPVATEPAIASLLPDDCRALFSREMITQLRREGLSLGSALSGREVIEPGSGDRHLRSLMRNETSVGCYWLDADGSTTAAVLTTVMEPGAAVVADVEARLKRLDFVVERDGEGKRYYIETTVEGEPRGESHYLRGGVWLATHWHGFGPRGYSVDMARNLFGQG